MKNFDELLSFFEEYTEFFLEFEAAEKDKLSSLATWDLKGIEHSLSIQQANQKKMEVLELHREKLQKKYGFEGYTFSQVIEAVPEEYQQELRNYFDTVQKSISQVQYLNGKSLEVAGENIRTIGGELKQEPETLLPKEYANISGEGIISEPRLEIKI